MKILTTTLVTFFTFISIEMVSCNTYLIKGKPQEVVSFGNKQVILPENGKITVKVVGDVKFNWN